jgi:hypothetical protein
MGQQQQTEPRLETKEPSSRCEQTMEDNLEYHLEMQDLEEDGSNDDDLDAYTETEELDKISFSEHDILEDDFDLCGYFIQLLERARGKVLEFDTYEQRNAFIDEHGTKLQAVTVKGASILHIAAEYTSTSPLPVSNIGSVLRLIVQKYPVLMETLDSYGNTPLHLAIHTKNTLFVETLRDTFEDLNKVLKIPDALGMNCIHAAIYYKLPIELAIRLVKLADEETICIEDSDGLTPLHLAVEYRRCTELQLALVKEILKKGGKAFDKVTKDGELSAYQYHKYTLYDSYYEIYEHGEGSDDTVYIANTPGSFGQR